MVYMGSKNRLAKELVPIIQSYITEETKGYIEPFVGGANVIDKIKCDKKIGCDIHKQLIELLIYISKGNELPNTISEELYYNIKNNQSSCEDWYLGLVGFSASYGGKYFDTYARSKKSNGELRDMANERINNLKKQAPNLKDINFLNISFDKLPKETINNCVIYCDPPYRNTAKYSTETFPYELFYDWCRKMSKDNIVLISEYNMPDDFECIWSKEHSTLLYSNKDSNDEKNIRIEKLFRLR